MVSKSTFEYLASNSSASCTFVTRKGNPTLLNSVISTVNQSVSYIEGEGVSYLLVALCCIVVVRCVGIVSTKTEGTKQRLTCLIPSLSAALWSASCISSTFRFLPRTNRDGSHRTSGYLAFNNLIKSDLERSGRPNSVNSLFLMEYQSSDYKRKRTGMMSNARGRVKDLLYRFLLCDRF